MPNNLKTLRRAMQASSAMVLGLLVAALPAAAQSTVDQPTPPSDYNVDANGVDLITGAFYVTTRDLNIGGGGSSGLSYSRSNRNQGYDDSFTTSVNSSGTTVVIGSMRDTMSAGKSTLGSGATISSDVNGNFTYVTSDGVQYKFLQTYRSTRIRLADQRVSEIIWPDGRRLTLEYDLSQVCFKASSCNTEDPLLYYESRVWRVSSNDGYRLVLRYKLATIGSTNVSYQQATDWMTVASVVASNSATEYCDRNNCLPGGSWPSVAFGYAPSGSNTVETRTDAENRTSTITYNSSYQITAVNRDSLGLPPATLTYDGNGRVQTYTIGSGAGAHTWTYTYDDSVSGQRTTNVQAPTGLVRTVVSDPAMLVLKSDKTGTAAAVTFEHDTQTRLTKITMPENNTVAYEYDGRSNVKKVTRTAKSGGATIVTEAGFPSDTECASLGAARCNLPTWTKDANGSQTDYAYEVFGAPARITLPAPASGAARPQTRYTYQPLTAWYRQSSTGGVTAAATTVQRLTATSQCITGGNTDTSAASCSGSTEARTEIGYGAANASNPNNLLPRQVTQRSGVAMTATNSSMQGVGYDGMGNVNVVDGPLAGDDVSYRFYNKNRELTGAVGPLPGGTSYDGVNALKRRAVRVNRATATGLVTSTEVGTSSTTNMTGFTQLQRNETDYDSATYQKTAERFFGGSTQFSLTQWSYDADLRPRCANTRISLTTPSTADPCEQLGNSSTGYDQVAETVYGTDGRVHKQRQNGADVATLVYRQNGTLDTLTDANGNVTKYEYDLFDRPVKTTYAFGTGLASSEEIAQYDAVGNVLQKKHRDSSVVVNTYDGLNRLKTRTPPAASNIAPVTYSYDNLGRLTQAQGAGTGAWYNNVALTYDALSRITTQVSNVGGTATHPLSMEYDAAGRRTKLTYGLLGSWGGGQ